MVEQAILMKLKQLDVVFRLVVLRKTATLMVERAVMVGHTLEIQATFCLCT